MCFFGFFFVLFIFFCFSNKLLVVDIPILEIFVCMHWTCSCLLLLFCYYYNFSNTTKACVVVLVRVWLKAKNNVCCFKQKAKKANQKKEKKTRTKKYPQLLLQISFLLAFRFHNNNIKRKTKLPLAAEMEPTSRHEKDIGCLSHITLQHNTNTRTKYICIYVHAYTHIY